MVRGLTGEKKWRNLDVDGQFLDTEVQQEGEDKEQENHERGDENRFRLHPPRWGTA